MPGPQQGEEEPAPVPWVDARVHGRRGVAVPVRPADRKKALTCYFAQRAAGNPGEDCPSRIQNVDVGTDDGGGLISSITDRAGGMVLTATGAARPLRSATSFVGSINTPGWGLDGLAQCFLMGSLSTVPTGAVGGTEAACAAFSSAGFSGRAALSFGMVRVSSVC